MDEIKEITTAEVVDIQFRPGQKVYFFGTNGLKLKRTGHGVEEIVTAAVKVAKDAAGESCSWWSWS